MMEDSGKWQTTTWQTTKVTHWYLFTIMNKLLPRNSRGCHGTRSCKISSN